MRAWFSLGILLLTLGCQLSVLNHLGAFHHEHGLHTAASLASHGHDHGAHEHSHSHDHDHPEQDHELPLALKYMPVYCIPVRPLIAKIQLRLLPANGWRSQGAYWVPQRQLYERGHSRAPPSFLVC